MPAVKDKLNSPVPLSEMVTSLPTELNFDQGTQIETVDIPDFTLMMLWLPCMIKPPEILWTNTRQALKLMILFPKFFANRLNVFQKALFPSTALMPVLK